MVLSVIAVLWILASCASFFHGGASFDSFVPSIVLAVIVGYLGQFFDNIASLARDISVLRKLHAPTPHEKEQAALYYGTSAQPEKPEDKA